MKGDFLMSSSRSFFSLKSTSVWTTNMKFNIIIIILIIFCKVEAQRVTDYVISQNCTEVYSITTPKYVPYEETYRTKTWYGAVKYKTRTNYRLENHVSYQRRAVCCTGYANYGANLCIPVCSRNCGTNGVCAQPETCKCNKGYKMDQNFNECKPVCENECTNGDCVAPNVCACKEGFGKNNETKFGSIIDDNYCQPICNCTDHEYCVEPHICRCIDQYVRHPIERIDRSPADECKPVCDRGCINADCVGPNVCKCHEGYVDFDNDVYACEPFCSLSCIDGECIAPEKCLCDSGYKLAENSTNFCKPVCTEKCINGTCIAPEVCSCNDGYVGVGGDSSPVCQPYCSSSCAHGRCIEPEKCACDAGYSVENGETTCEPICSETCYMGNCTAPDTCTCLEGYKLQQESNFTCEPICNEECINGQCTAPYECTCNDGYEKKNSTDNDSKCIVICECEYGYCNEASSICETCAEGYELTPADNSTVCKPHCEGGCENGLCIEPQKCECNENYLSDNDTRGNPICVHACGGECIHGTCILESGACSCLYGWAGKYCDEASFCAIVVTENQTDYLMLNETAGYDEAENATDLEEPWTGPSCNIRCLQEINNMTKCVNQLDGKQSRFICFIHIDAPCNIYSVILSNKNAAEVSMTTIVASIVIAIIVATAICTTIIIKKRRRQKSVELMKSMQQTQKREEDCLIENENDGISL